MQHVHHTHTRPAAGPHPAASVAKRPVTADTPPAPLAPPTLAGLTRAATQLEQELAGAAAPDPHGPHTVGKATPQTTAADALRSASAAAAAHAAAQLSAATAKAAAARHLDASLSFGRTLGGGSAHASPLAGAGAIRAHRASPYAAAAGASPQGGSTLDVLRARLERVRAGTHGGGGGGGAGGRAGRF